MPLLILRLVPLAVHQRLRLFLQVSPGGSTNPSFSASSVPSSTSDVTSVIYLSAVETEGYCMGIVGTGNSTNRFCTSKECKIAKHESQKFAFQPGLFIFKTVSEWVSIFAQISALGIKIDASDWQEKEKLQQRAKSTKTPRKSKTQRSQAWGDLRNISADFDALRNSLSGGTAEESTVKKHITDFGRTNTFVYR